MTRDAGDRRADHGHQQPPRKSQTTEVERVVAPGPGSGTVPRHAIQAGAGTTAAGRPMLLNSFGDTHPVPPARSPAFAAARVVKQHLLLE